MKTNPYEYYDKKLGIKLGFIVSDKDRKHEESLALISYNALYKRMKSDTCTEKQLRRASLNMDALVLFSSLTQDWKDAITVKFGSPKEEIKKSWFAENYESDRKAWDFYAAYTYGESLKLDLKLVETYMYNASVLNTVIKIKTNRKAYAKALGCTQLDIWESLTKDVNAFRDVPHNLPTTSRGLRIKVSDYLKYGYVSVISGRLQNQNASKVKQDDQVALLDEIMAKHQNFDNSQVANFYNMVAERINWKTITAQTVANHKEERNLVVFAGRKGSTALSNKVLMQNKRMAPSKPMLYWTLDGWDAELLFQKTTVDGKGRTTTTYHNRLTMVAVLDPFNKYPIGYAIGTHETPELIKDALRNAVQHTKELFGGYFRPYQLQSDNYGRGTLNPLYEACSTHYTPAKIKNAKAKVIEPWFNRFNKDYCQVFDNWSGHNVNSGSKNQPNDEMLNKLRHQFPDENGCRQQLVMAIEADRAKKREEYVSSWDEVPAEYRSEMILETYLRVLGKTTGFTNRLQPEGLTPTINGVTLNFDSFDINFRKLAHLDWAVKYDPSDLSKVLVVNAESKGGKLVEEIGTYQFVLQQKYVQAMALAERNDDDAKQLQAVKNYNTDVMSYISDTRESNYEKVAELFQRPELNDTLTKHLLVDSRGQHKNRKSDNRLNEKVRELIEVQTIETTQNQENNWNNQQNEYHKSKINLNEYL